MNVDQIERVFGALGRIESKLDSHVDTVEKHVAHDETIQKLLFERIETLQLSHARQKGFVTALVAAGSAIAGAIGWALEYFLGRH